EVGNSLTKIVEMAYKAKTARARKCINIPTPDEVFDDGYISDSEEFAKTLKQALTDNKIKTRQAICTITCSKIANREVLLPNVKTNQIDDLVRANAGEYFPVDLSQYELGYIVLGRESAEADAKLKVMLLACEKELIKGYDTLFAQAGLKLVGVDYAGNSVVQIMKKEVTEETEMVIKVEEQSTIATIISGGNLMMQRNLGYGVDDAIQTMMASKAFPETGYGECIEALKKNVCIMPSLNSDDEENIALKKSLEAPIRKARTEMTEALGPLVGNVGRVLDLYNSKNLEHPITKVSMIGLGSQIMGLDKLFTKELGVTTESVNTVKSVSKPIGVTLEAVGEYITAMGASINPVGFITGDKSKGGLKFANYITMSVLVLLIIGGLTAVMYMMAKQPYDEAVLQNASLRNLQKKYEPALKVKEQSESVQALYNEIVRLNEYTYNNNNGLLAFLGELEAKLPTEASVDTFISDGSQATITIRVPILMDVAGIIQNIREFETLESVKVSTVSRVSEKEEPIKHAEKEESDDFEEEASADTYYVFTIECVFKAVDTFNDAQ
ncbi:MAG: pilus assembly protein PilM, partial [Lachnospiraceae bacterium]|nr:pilus assembly protein PilM [Lachnospiraceae bacterium]